MLKTYEYSNDLILKVDEVSTRTEATSLGNSYQS